MSEARILIVEDEAVIALDLEQRLETLGYTVPAVVSSGEAALQEATEIQPDLVLMDIQLQGELSGTDAAAHISTRLKIPVIYLTGHVDEITVQEAQDTTPFGYLLKPVENHELQVSIETTLYRHAVEQKLRMREQRLAAVLGSIGDAVMTTDRDGVVTFMNPRAETLTGWSQEDALGRNCREVLTFTDAGPLTSVDACLHGALEDKNANNLGEGVVLSRAGTRTPVSGSVSPISDGNGAEMEGFVLSFRDITQRRQAEDRLRESEERLRNLFEEMPIGIYQTLPDGRILEANPALVHMLGYASLEELKQCDLESERPVLGHQPSDFRKRIEEDGRITDLESSWKRKDGSKILVRENARAVRDEEGDILYFEGMVEDITEHRSVQKKLERRVSQLTLLNDIGGRIAATLELDPILDKSIQLVRESFGYQHVALFMLDPEREEAVLKAGAGDYADAIPPDHRETLNQGTIGWVARQGRMVLVNDLEAEPLYKNLQPDAVRTRSQLCVPIRVRGKVVGVLDVQSPRLNVFDASDVTVMQTVAQQIGLALWRARLYEAAQKRSKRLAVLNAVSSAVFSSLEPETVMDQILAMTRQAFEAPEGSILLRDRDTGELFFALTSSAEQDGNPALEHVRIQPGEGIAGWVVENNQAVVVNDVQADPRWYGGVDGVSGFDTRSLMSAPLERRREIIGAVEIISDRKAAFTDEDLSLFEALCSIAAVGLDNARLYAAMRSQADRLALLHQVGQALSSTLDYDKVIRLALSKIRALFPSDGVWFVEPEPDAAGVRLAAALTDQRAVDVPFPVASGEGISVWALKKRQPVLVEDAPADQRFSPAIDQQLGIETRAMMVTPLTNTDRPLGAISVSSSQRATYDRGDLNMLQAIASTMSIALDNARLYENLKSLLREREETEARLIQSEKMAALGRLIATITHEVNNPLQAIQGCLSLAKEEIVGRQRQEKLGHYIDVSSTEIEHIADIVRRTRAFYRPELGGPRSVDLHAELDSVLALSRKQLEDSSIVVEREYAADLPTICAHADQLRQVLLNLVLNAIDAMPTGGTLSIRTAADGITTDSRRKAVPAVRVQVSDTGEGISPEMAPHIFEPFVTTKENGTGLGLFVTYGVIQAHHGEITATSEPGEGATFTVLLPVRQIRRQPAD
jgi:PAS domain S-box-containing protein